MLDRAKSVRCPFANRAGFPCGALTTRRAEVRRELAHSPRAPLTISALGSNRVRGQLHRNWQYRANEGGSVIPFRVLMTPEDELPSPERAQTDESLRAERERTDDALAEDVGAVDEAADSVVEKARVRADEVLAAARAKTDQHGASKSQPPDMISRERVLEDHCAGPCVAVRPHASTRPSVGAGLSNE